MRARVETCRSRGYPFGTPLERGGKHEHAPTPRVRSVRTSALEPPGGGRVFVNYLVRTSSSARPAGGGGGVANPVRPFGAIVHVTVGRSFNQSILLTYSPGSLTFVRFSLISRIAPSSSSRSGLANRLRSRSRAGGGGRGREGGQLRRAASPTERCPESQFPPPRAVISAEAKPKRSRGW